jgi:hypothetical protein
MKNTRSISFASVFLLLMVFCSTPVCAEYLVNTNVTGGQYDARITRLSDGGYVIVWISRGQDGDSGGIYGQRFDGSGNKIGAEFLINTTTQGDQWYPEVADLRHGGFIVVWDSNQTDPGYDVFGRQYDDNGVPLGPEFRINTYLLGQQRKPLVAGLADGGFVVVWNSAGQDGSGGGIYGQKYAQNGSRLSSEFRVNSVINGDQATRQRAIVGFDGGGFLVTFDSWDPDMIKIYGHGFDANGVDLGEFVVNTSAAGHSLDPAVTELTDGSFVVTWAGLYDYGQTQASYAIFGRRFTKDTLGFHPSGDEFKINSNTFGTKSFCSVAGLTNGDFVVTWIDGDGQDGSSFGNFGRIFNGSCNPLGEDFRINTYVLGHQSFPAVAALSNGRFVVACKVKGKMGVIMESIRIYSIPLRLIYNRSPMRA